MSPAFFCSSSYEWMLQAELKSALKNKCLHDLLDISAGSIQQAGYQAGER